MTSEQIRQAVMKHRTKQGLAVMFTMPERNTETFYFASESTRDDFMRRVRLNGGAAEIAG